MNEPPKISIVTPSYGNAATIEETIESVQSQRYENFEHIIIDGAGDDTAKLLQKYDESLEFWSSEPDEGQYDAIRKGFRRALGEILCWLNADDKLLPGALEIVGGIFSRFSNVKWISSLAPGHFDAAGFYRGHGSIPGFSRQAFRDGFYLPGTKRRGHWIQQESTFFRKSLWDAVERPFEGFDLAGDFSLWCEFYKRADLVGVTYPLAGFRHIAGQRSEARADYVREARLALDEFRRSTVMQSNRPGGRALWRKANLPGYGATLSWLVGYNGMKIMRTRHRYPDAYWTMKPCCFHP